VIRGTTNATDTSQGFFALGDFALEIIRAYKTELNPNNKQQTFFGRCCGASRFTYNWGLAEWKRQYEQWKEEPETAKKPSMYSLKKQFNAQKDDICPWIRSLPYAVTESAFINLGLAYKNFFRRVRNGEKELGYPKFKKRGRSSSFQIRGARVESSKVRIPRVGWVRLKERNYIPIDGVFTAYATVSEKAGRWYISMQAKEEMNPSCNGTLVVGVDFGINTLAVCSDGTEYENPRPLRIAQRALGKLNRELARRNRGGQNWKKTKMKLQRQHARVANIRKHTLHEISSDLVGKPVRTIVIENLNVGGMMKNHRLAQAITDVSFAELKRQIEYKAAWSGIEVVLASQWFPSSKACSGCGCIKENLTLANREYTCEHCGLVIDRDLNAALNLAALGEP